MNQNAVFIARMSYIIGAVLLLLSFFFPWYKLEIIDSNQDILALWSYNLFTRWSLLTPEVFIVESRPHPIDISTIIIISNVIVIIISMGIAVIFDIEKEELSNRMKYSSYFYVSTLIINTFFCFIFPILYLSPNELYFPYGIYRDDKNLIWRYMIGPGYILQLVGFIIIFPYVIFYAETLLKFKKKIMFQDSLIAEDISRALDKLIAEEQSHYQPKSKIAYSFNSKRYKRE